MAAESWKRPSFVLAVWAVLLTSVFIVRGDLRVRAPGKPQAPTDSSAIGATEDLRRAPPGPRGAMPQIVKAERSARQATDPSRVCKGRVFDAMGFLVVGAEVLSGERGMARTDADGVFQLELVEGSLVNVLVRAKGLQSRRLAVSTASPDPLLVQLAPAAPWDVAAPPLPTATSALVGEGLVRTAQGAPVVGAYVTTVGSGSWSRTDEIGRYVLPLPSQEVILVLHQADGGIDGRGLAARSEPLDLGRTQGVVPLPELTASAAGSIRGVVRDSRGTPIEGVPVQLRGEGIARVFESGPGGIFRLGGLQAGRYTVRPFAFRGALGTPHEVMLNGPVVDCDLHLQSAEERRLRLLDEKGVPVGRAYVATAFAGERNCVAQTDAEGWTALMLGDADLGDGLEFEVRTGAGHEPVTVRRYEAEHSTLVVAMP